MADINIKKGHDIQISGKPELLVYPLQKSKTVAIKPSEFRGIKPKLLVKEGDEVKIGTPIFYHKSNPDLKFPSVGCGVVEKIQIGPRRSMEKIIIKLSDKENCENFKSYRLHEINTLSRENIVESFIAGCLFPFIRQRPFNKIPTKIEFPRDIFISGINTAPLSVDLDLALQRKQSQFQAGIFALNKLTDGNVHITYSEDTVSDTMLETKGAVHHTISGPHPAGNIGIQIHHIAPLNLKDIVWTLNAQDVVRIGTFFLTGELDVSNITTVVGPSVKKPAHYISRIGNEMTSIVHDNLQDENFRLISGDVLTGNTSSMEGHSNFYDTTITVIPENDEREFLGMLRPGSSTTRYSLTRAFFGSKSNGFDFSTSKNGSERYVVPINAWEDVLPMDIMPNPLYRAILVEDIEEMEQLGIIECDDEDFALCSFACPSKIDVGGTIRQGLDLMEKES